MRKTLPPSNSSQPSTPAPKGSSSQSRKDASVSGKGNSSTPGTLTKFVLSPSLSETSSEGTVPSNLGYSIIKDMKKTRANISLYELAELANQRELIVKDFATSSSTSKATSLTKTSSHSQSRASVDLQAIVNAANANSRGSTPPFLLTFEIFNYNVHNCLVDSGASTNVMPLSVCKKKNIQPEKADAKIIHLDKSQVPAVGELNNVVIRVSFDSRVHQCIDIIVIDIPEAYGLLLSRDWLSKLQGYFAIDWSHLWLPYKGKNNQIRVNSEPYMTHMVTDLEGSNEPISFAQEKLGMCFLEA